MNVKDFTALQLDSMGGLVGTLTGKTQKGKQRVKQWGNRGKILRVQDSIPASPKKGLWFAVTAGDPSWRWVLFGQDPDFDLVVTPWADDPDMLEARTHATTKDD